MLDETFRKHDFVIVIFRKHDFVIVIFRKHDFVIVTFRKHDFVINLITDDATTQVLETIQLGPVRKLCRV